MSRFLACATLVAFLFYGLAASPVCADMRRPAMVLGEQTIALPKSLGVKNHVLKRPVEDKADGDFVPVTISLNYPAFGQAAIDNDIREWAASIADAFEKHFDGTILAPIDVPDDGDMIDTDKAEPAPVSLDLQASYTVSRPSGNAVSITFELWNYTGGPSGNMDIITLNYSLITGQRLDLVDLFELPETALELMSTYARRELGKSMGGQRLMTGTEALPENFASLTLTPEGIRIHFQPYQVAGWEMGAQEVDMPLSELAPAGPLLTLWGK